MKTHNALLVFTLLTHVLCVTHCLAVEQSDILMRDYNVTPVEFNMVRVDDDFWSPRLDTNRTVTIPYAFEKCQETGRISNFEKSAGLMTGDHNGICFDDSDVYKIMEGAAYSLQVNSDR